MKRKRLLLILGCLAAILLAGYATLWLTAPRHHISEETCEAIKEGMTEDEVEDILGARAGVYTSLCQTGSYPIGRCGDPMLGEEMTKHWGGKEWVTEKTSVYILFNENGRVARKCRGTGLPHGKESFFAKLRRWLGM